MKPTLKNIPKAICIFFAVVGLSLILLSCASNSSKSADRANDKFSNGELADADVETLKDLWLLSENLEDRSIIVEEFKRRKSADGLGFCLLYTAGIAGKRHSIKESIDIINALGKTKKPDAVGQLTGCIRGYQDNKDFLMAVLQAFAEIGSPEAVSPTAQILQNPDPDIRIIALDTLGQIKSSKSIEFILPSFFDKDARIRWKAVDTLREIGDPKTAPHISLLLGDTDKSVRTISEITLRRLGVPEKQIAEWKNKVGQISIEDIYSLKLAQQKAEIEKQELAKRLKSEQDLKKQLEESLKSRESALEKQNKLVDSLYDKERELKSKQAQLDIAREQSSEYQKELKQLNARLLELNRELKKTQNQTANAKVKSKLDQTLQEKSQLESNVKLSREKESKLKQEIAGLSDVAEQTRIEAEKAKEELADLRNREKQLSIQVAELKERLSRGMAPVLVISKPKDGSKIESPHTLLHFIAVDDKGISKIDVSLNGQPVEIDHERGIKITEIDREEIAKKIDITKKLNLEYGQNVIVISATDTDGVSKEESITISRVKERGDIWAIVIGINQYQNARNLKYAVNDAQAFKDYLKDYVGITDERIFYLVNQDATKIKIESLLATIIRRKASKDDTVIIFYAGHGAVEPDPSNFDGDGFEKYLLPYDANLEDLYTTSISMNDIRTIFMRISAERLIFIADTCYSGASGGRTMVTSKTRANLSDKFYERISKGKGRVIISSCSANEISKEDDNLQHGIFSYHMLEGLKGRADQNGDGIITISELFSYLSQTVPEASAQDQHPVKKGETEGELVIGRTK